MSLMSWFMSFGSGGLLQSGRVDSEKAAGESGGRMWVEDHIGETPTKREAIRLLIYVITAGVDLFCLDAEHWREKVHPQ